MSKHTSRKWQIGHVPDSGTEERYNAACIYADDEDKTIAQVYGIYQNATLSEIENSPQCAEGLANARLIARSPEMYDLLSEIKAKLDPTLYGTLHKKISALLQEVEEG